MSDLLALSTAPDPCEACPDRLTSRCEDCDRVPRDECCGKRLRGGQCADCPEAAGRTKR